LDERNLVNGHAELEPGRYLSEVAHAGTWVGTGVATLRATHARRQRLIASSLGSECVEASGLHHGNISPYLAALPPYFTGVAVRAAKTLGTAFRNAIAIPRLCFGRASPEGARIASTGDQAVAAAMTCPHRPPRRRPEHHQPCQAKTVCVPLVTMKGASYRLRRRGIDSLPSIKTQEPGRLRPRTGGLVFDRHIGLIFECPRQHRARGVLRRQNEVELFLG
jgi:hypothetical protein